MMNFGETLKRGVGAVVLAAALGAGGLAATPAAAQAPSFNFGIGVDGNGQPSFNFGINNNRAPGWRRNYCMTDREVVRSLDRAGYSRIDIVRSSRRSAIVEARYRRADYELHVDKCSGEVEVLDVERRRPGRPDRGPNRPGFSFDFNLGN